jgi:uncharacterized protein (TIGR02145 family)
MKKMNSFVIFLLIGSFILSSCNKENTEADIVKDIDGNTYHYITIGNQVWFKENLRTTKLNDGTDIPLIVDNAEWSELETMSYSWFDHNDSNYKNEYGALYNWYTVSTEKLCPEGWHVPSHSEFVELADFLGGKDIAGGKMKETGFDHWKDPNEGATNEGGFTGLGHGQRNTDGTFGYMLEYGLYWTQTEALSYTAHSYGSGYQSTTAYGYQLSGSTIKRAGLAVRCVKD